MYLVTGGAGFIGSNIVAALARRTSGDVVVCDRLESGEKWKNIAKCEVADIVPPERLADLLDARGGSFEAVLHMGAVSSTTERDVDRIVESNLRLSLDLWDWCARRRVRLIYASSAATYGDGSAGFDDDGGVARLAALRPLNAYGWSKHVFDRIVARRAARNEPAPPQWAGLKFFNVYGPNEYHKGPMQSVAAKAYPAVVSGEPVRLFRSARPDVPDGGQRRDFVYVKDCVRVVDWLLQNPDKSGIFNVGSGEARSFLDLVRAVFAAAGRPERIEYVETPAEIRNNYQYFTQANINRLRREGFDAPMHSLEDGVADYVIRHLSQDDRYAGPETYAAAPFEIKPVVGRPSPARRRAG
jgi:ADP-L-glycero-D-manno-heptose 6-epimerase